MLSDHPKLMGALLSPPDFESFWLSHPFRFFSRILRGQKLLTEAIALFLSTQQTLGFAGIREDRQEVV